MTERAAWLRRREGGFGGSDVPSLLVAVGRRRSEDVPRYVAQRARHVIIRGSIAGVESAPRLFAEKAGLVAPTASTPTMERGTAREGELVATWRGLVAAGQFYGEHEAVIEASSIVRAGPQRIMPLADLECLRLRCTPDAWCEDVFGAFVTVQTKCGYGEKRALAVHHRDQVLAEIAATNADYGLLVHGDYWSREEGAPPGDGPVRSWLVERDERAIAEIRAACLEGWEQVERLRAAAAAEVAA